MNQNVAYAYGLRLPARWGIRPDGHTLACPRIPVRRLMAYDSEGRLDRDSPKNLLPLKFVEALEQNQDAGIRSCCRHPEHHLVEAYYSSAAESLPDVYRFICTGFHPDILEETDDPDEVVWHRNEREHGWAFHVRFCVGMDDMRPYWEVR